MCIDTLKAAAGVLSFTDRQQYTDINITILRWANSTERDQTFDVELLNPSGGASIGIASTISITLLAGTRAYGVFYFADQSLSVTVAEDLDRPVVEAIFEVTISFSTLANIFQPLLYSSDSITWTDNMTDVTCLSRFQRHSGLVLVVYDTMDKCLKA